MENKKTSSLGVLRKNLVGREILFSHTDYSGTYEAWRTVEEVIKTGLDENISYFGFCLNRDIFGIGKIIRHIPSEEVLNLIINNKCEFVSFDRNGDKKVVTAKLT